MLATSPTPARRLRVEHAVAGALVEDAPMEDVLRAIGEGLGRHYGGAWLAQGGAVRARRRGRCPRRRVRRGVARSCSASEKGLSGRVGESGHPAWIADVGTDGNFPRGW